MACNIEPMKRCQAILCGRRQAKKGDESKGETDVRRNPPSSAIGGRPFQYGGLESRLLFFYRDGHEVEEHLV